MVITSLRVIKITLLLFVLTIVSVISVNASEKDCQERCAILLHGLGRTSWSMNTMAKALKKSGYTVVNQGYPSRDKSIEVLAIEALTEAEKECVSRGAERIDVVTHSMGGILLRYYLEQKELGGLHHVVMLSPPNQGSEAADGLKEKGYYRWYNGPAGQQLGTSRDSLVMKLGPVDFTLGIITGSEHSFFDGRLAEMIPGEDDGKVSVARAKVEGMADFLVLPYTHTTIMKEPEVIQQTLHFLEKGSFSEEFRRHQEPAQSAEDESSGFSQDS